MAINRVKLEDVISDAKAALEAGNPDKAIALCHHIFNFYPRCLEASRMLGEAYTEQRLFTEADQLFVFVLSADPQDVLGYVDRGFIAYEQSRIDDAILYCERALELDPSIEQLREELLRLYRERSNGGRAQIRMTKVGLANARLRDGLYGQAIEEYTTVLRQTPNRLDVQVGLMEAYWRNRDYGRAEQLALELLENNAYLVKANLILWHIYGVRRNQGRAADYLEQAHTLDPLNLLAERLFEDSSVSGDALSHIAMLGEPSIPAPDSENGAGEKAAKPGLVPEWATGRQETDVVLGLRADLPSADEVQNNLGFDLFALLSDTERHVAQQQEEAAQPPEQVAPQPTEPLTGLEELRLLAQSEENDSVFNLFEEVESPQEPDFERTIKPAVGSAAPAPGAFDLDFSLARDGDLSLFEEISPVDQFEAQEATPFSFEPELETEVATNTDSGVVPFAFDEDASPAKFSQDIPPFFLEDDSVTAVPEPFTPFTLAENTDAAGQPLEPFSFGEPLDFNLAELPASHAPNQPGQDQDLEDLEATDSPAPYAADPSPFSLDDLPGQDFFSDDFVASPARNELDALQLVQPDEGPGLPLNPGPEPQPILIPTPQTSSESPASSPEEPGSGQSDSGSGGESANDQFEPVPASEPPGLPETTPGSDSGQPLPMFEAEAGSASTTAFEAEAGQDATEDNGPSTGEDYFAQAAPGVFVPSISNRLEAPAVPAPDAVFREPYAFYKRNEQGPIPDFVTEQTWQGSNLDAFEGLADLEPATIPPVVLNQFAPEEKSETAQASETGPETSPLTTSPNQMQENPEMPIRRGQEDENDLFDWEREELPDYLHAFIMDEEEIEQSGLSTVNSAILEVNTPPARIRPRDDTGANNLGTLPEWLMPEKAVTPPPPPPPMDSFDENDGADISTFDRLGLGTSALPSWLDTPAPGYNPAPPPPANRSPFGGSDFGDLSPFSLDDSPDFGAEASAPPPPPHRASPPARSSAPAVNQGFAELDDLQPFSFDEELGGFEPPVPPKPLIDRSKETRPYTRNFGDSAPPVPPAPVPAFDLGLDMDDLTPFSLDDFDATLPQPPQPPASAASQSPSAQRDRIPPPQPSFLADEEFGDLLPFNLDDDSGLASPPPPPPPPFSAKQAPSFADQMRQNPSRPSGFDAAMDSIQPFILEDFDESPFSPPSPPAWQGPSSRQPSAYVPQPPPAPGAQPDFDMEPFSWDNEAGNIFGAQGAANSLEDQINNPFGSLNERQPEVAASESDEEKPLRQFEWVKQRTAPAATPQTGEQSSLFGKLAARRKVQEDIQPVRTPAPAQPAPGEITGEDLLPLAELEARAARPEPEAAREASPPASTTASSREEMAAPAPASVIVPEPAAVESVAPAATREAVSGPSLAPPASGSLSPVEENLQKAYQFFDQQDYTQSLNFFSQAVKVAGKAELPEIVTKLQEIVNSAESSSRFHRVLGDAYKKQGQFQAALAEYSKALAPAGAKK